MIGLLPVLLKISIILLSFKCFSITWEQQAQRLQKLLGHVGIENVLGDYPTAYKLSYGVLLKTSFFPKINNRVGQKSEGGDIPRYNTVPTLFLSKRLLRKYGVLGQGRIYGGYFFEKMNFISDNKVEQWQLYGDFTLSTKISKRWKIYFPIIGGYSLLNVSGALSSKSGEDTFSSKTLLGATGLGLVRLKYNVWISFLAGQKSVKTQLTIFEDKTVLTFEDILNDTPTKMTYWFNIGKKWGSWKLNFTYVLIPQRLAFPQLAILYERSF